MADSVQMELVNILEKSNRHRLTQSRKRIS
jgi:hypothetical protein